MSKGLGDLIKDMQIIISEYPNVLKQKKDVPEESLKNYNKYCKIIQEINKKGEDYSHYKYPPKIWISLL